MKLTPRSQVIGTLAIAAAVTLLLVHQDRRQAQVAAGCCGLMADTLSLPPVPEAHAHSVNTGVRAEDGFFPEWAEHAPFTQAVLVRDTESALGRLSTQPKAISLKDLARMHGHLCDGLVISFVELKAALLQLFPDGVVDRTDLRVVSKNGPCWVDAAAWLTGARIAFQTTWEVRLKPGVFPEPQAKLESHIRELWAAGQLVNPADVDRFEAMANELSRHLLNTPPAELLVLTARPGYRFQFNDLYGGRGDIINRDLRQQPATLQPN